MPDCWELPTNSVWTTVDAGIPAMPPDKPDFPASMESDDDCRTTADGEFPKLEFPDCSCELPSGDWTTIVWDLLLAEDCPTKAILVFPTGEAVDQTGLACKFPIGDDCGKFSWEFVGDCSDTGCITGAGSRDCTEEDGFDTFWFTNGAVGRRKVAITLGLG